MSKVVFFLSFMLLGCVGSSTPRNPMKFKPTKQVAKEGLKEQVKKVKECVDGLKKKMEEMDKQKKAYKDKYL